jgi:ribosomal protein S18 acetylase RimI-like enzyme
MRKSLTISAFYRIDTERPWAVRRLAETDWRAFAALRLQALADTLGEGDPQHRDESTFTAAQWRRRLRVHAQFAAVVGDRPVGLIGAQRESAASVYLYSLWLEPGARRRGLGRALVAAAVQWARAEGARTVTLRVHTDNAAAKGVYEGLGFHPVAAAGAEHPTEIVMALDVR